MPSRKEILEKAAEIVSGEREDTYGGPEDSFRLIAKLWEAYLGAAERVITPEDVAAMMALLKIARLAKSSDHLDSWIDLAGYAACGGEIGERSIKTEDLSDTASTLCARTY